MATSGITNMVTNGIISIDPIITETVNRETANIVIIEIIIREITVHRQTDDNQKIRTLGRKTGMMGDGLVEFGLWITDYHIGKKNYLPDMK